MQELHIQHVLNCILLLAVLQESIEQYGIKQRSSSSSVFQASPNIPKKKGSKKKKTK